MAAETTTTSAGAWRPDVTTFAAEDIVGDALILQTSTVVGEVDGDQPVVRVGYVTDDEATIVPEGQPIPEADPGLDEVLIQTVKVAQLVRLSREQFFQAGTSERIAASVQRAVQRSADIAYVTQAAPAEGTFGPTGLLNIDGTTAGGEVADTLDPLIDLLASLESAGGTPSQIALDPLGWAGLRKMKTGDGDATNLLGAGTTDAVPMLLGLPVVVSTAVPQGSGLVLDATAVVSSVGAVLVATDESVYFDSDSVAARCTWRIGWNVVRPERVGTFTVASMGS